MSSAQRAPRVVVFAATRAYQSGELAAAAERLGIELVLATDRCHVLARGWREGSIPVDFTDPAAAAETAAAALGDRPVAGAIGTDEVTAAVAAELSARLGVASNPPEAARRAGDKLAVRRALTEAGLPQPRFAELAVGAARLGPSPVGYPAVIKPRCLSASRGVMRVDGEAELEAAGARLAELLADPEVRGRHGERAKSGIIESFVPGPEVAYEGVLRRGELRRLAIFDKPDPLDGPVFAETLYVTPSSLPGARQRDIDDAVSAAAAALGLREGPVHAELRLGAGAPVVIELAARSIGGLCGRALRIASGRSVEEVVVAHAAGVELELEPPRPAGVLMLPIREGGVLVEVSGVEEAEALEGIVEVAITVRPGEVLVPLPEGDQYLGFAFARGQDVGEVIGTLRAAQELLVVRVKPRLAARR